MSRMIAGAAALFLLASAPAWANASFYTPTGGAQCKFLPEGEGEVADWTCPAPKGFKAAFTAIDGTLGVRVLRVGQSPLSERSADVYWRGNMGERLEWRVSPDGVPLAAILRVIPDAVSDRGVVRAGASRLVVMKITSRGACRVGEIAGQQANANVAARALADAVAPETPCIAEKS